VALWAIELIDTVLSTVLIPVRQGDAVVIHDGMLDALCGVHPLDGGAALLPQLLWLPVGIVGAPLLHAGFYHLFQNSLALLLVGLLSLRTSRRLTYRAIGCSALISALLTWCIAPADQVHVGASGVIFGLVGFLLANGLLRKGCLPLLIAGLVLLVYGGSLSGMLPMPEEQRISWQMHLGGFIGGLLASWQLRHERA
jgi:membrane associated rhomboid family serine protease